MLCTHAPSPRTGAAGSAARPRGFTGLLVAATAVALALVLALAPASAHAQRAGSKGAAAFLEFYIRGENFKMVPERVSGLATALAGGVDGRPSVYTVMSVSESRRLLGAGLALSSRGTFSSERLQGIERLMKDGDQLLYTKPREAISVLQRAKEELREITEGRSLNAAVRKTYLETHLLLAVSHFQSGNSQGAKEVLEEVIRVFGDEATVTQENYHPGVVALYEQSKQELDAMDRASLSVETTVPGAEIIIHGLVQPRQSPATFSGLYPGHVTVQVRRAGQASLVHRVHLSAGQQKVLNIDLDFEAALVFDSKRLGLVFDSQDELRAKLPEYAARLGDLVRVEHVVVSGVTDVGGDPHLQSWVVEVKSRSVEQGPKSLKTFGDVVSRTRIRQMARWLNDPTTVQTVVYEPWYKNWVGWTGVGVGVVGGIVGAIFWSDYQSQLDEIQCTGGAAAGCKTEAERSAMVSDAETSRALAATSFVVGGVGLVGGIVAFVVMREEALDASDDVAYDEGLRLQTVGPARMPDGSTGLGAAFTF